tara:strand:+ start:385 stop:627 length:243 start_codon:yes stop_codon:yes gene_type:complete
MRVKKLLIKVELENGAECNYIEYQAFSFVLNGTPYIVNGEFDTIDFERIMNMSEESMRREGNTIINGQVQNPRLENDLDS